MATLVIVSKKYLQIARPLIDLHRVKYTDMMSEHWVFGQN